MKVNILGTEYSVVNSAKHKDIDLRNRCGYCDFTIKKIVVDDCKDEEGMPDRVENMPLFVKKNNTA